MSGFVAISVGGVLVAVERSDLAEIALWRKMKSKTRSPPRDSREFLCDARRFGSARQVFVNDFELPVATGRGVNVAVDPRSSLKTKMAAVAFLGPQRRPFFDEAGLSATAAVSMKN